MITKIFSVFDRASKTYSHPFYLLREEQAIRAFTDAINSPSHEFGKHPADYALFYMGEFDDLTGKHTSAAPSCDMLCTGLSVLAIASGKLTEGNDND